MTQTQVAAPPAGPLVFVPPDAITTTSISAVRGWRWLLLNRAAALSLAYLVLLTLAAVAAPLVAPFPPNEVQPSIRLQAPSLQHWMGTDDLGRDVFSRVVHGSHVSLPVALWAVGISSVVGVLLGIVAGYYGGLLDDLIRGFADVLLAFPSILLALGIVWLLQPGIISVAIAVGIAGIPQFIRVTRGATLAARGNPHVEAARAIGCGDARIMLRHVLPDVAAPIVVLVTLGFGTAILTAAALSFLGLGSKPPTPEWGTMMSAGRDFLRQAPWITNMPGLAILVTVMAVNTVGDALRDVFDPRQQRAG